MKVIRSYGLRRPSSVAQVTGTRRRQLRAGRNLAMRAMAGLKQIAPLSLGGTGDPSQIQKAPDCHLQTVGACTTSGRRVVGAGQKRSIRYTAKPRQQSAETLRAAVMMSGTPCGESPRVGKDPKGPPGRIKSEQLVAGLSARACRKVWRLLSGLGCECTTCHPRAHRAVCGQGILTGRETAVGPSCGRSRMAA